MRKKAVLAIVFFTLSGLSFAGFRFLQTREQSAVLQVTATPKSHIFLDGEFLGSTPLLKDKLKPGEYLVKIAPEDMAALVPFEQKIKLNSFLLTAVDRTFRETEASSEGSILTLESINDKNASEITVLSIPSEANVLLDNDIRGTAPIHIKDIAASDHEIALTHTGFVDKKVRVKTSRGYKLIANVKLAIALEEGKQSSPSPTITLTPTPASVHVTIRQTPTGFLRVRFSPSLSATEVARVKPAQTFPLLEEVSGWTKISLPDGTAGWVSNQYITKP